MFASSISPHLEIFRSEVPALFSISKRIFGVLLAMILFAKVVVSLFFSDVFVCELWQFFSLYNGFGLYGYTPAYFVAFSDFVAGLVVLEEVRGFYLGLFSFLFFSLDVLLLLSGGFYLVSLFMYKCDIRFIDYIVVKSSIQYTIVLIMVSVYFSILVWV